jgi:multicomponent Na+:H+ antiporter subunit D
MVGLPPTAGFVTKIYLGIGAVQAEAFWVLAVLAASTLLNAAYFLPLVYRIWFLEPGQAIVEGPAPTERPTGLIAPAVVTAFAFVAVGLLAASDFSPLAWATLIAERGYLP